MTVTYSGGGISISVTDTRYNGGDPNVCTGSGHIDGAPSNASSTMGPFQKAIHYAATNGIPTVTVPANSICNFPYVMSNTSGASCFAIDLENGVTIVGLGNDVINANVMGIQSSILPPNGCQTAWGQITQTDVFNVATNSYAAQYNHNGVGGFVSDATTAGQNKVFFTASHAESNFAVGNYVALFVQQATQDGVGPCNDTCTMQANLVTAVDPVGHSITLQDPLEYSFPSVGGTYPGPWIRVTPTTRHDVGVKNFTINTNIFPWQILEAWNVTMDSLTFNLQNCGACGGGIQDSDQWGVNTALHWNLTNSTLNWTRGGFKNNQETNQRESGYVLWQNVTITQPAGDAGGWTSMSYAEHVFRTTYDNVTLTGLIPDSTGAQQGAFLMGGSHNTLKNSHITLNENFVTTGSGCGSPGACGIVVTSYGNLAPYEGRYTVTNNVVTDAADGHGSMIALVDSMNGADVVSGNTTNILSTSNGTTYGFFLYSPYTCFTVSGNTNSGGAGLGMSFTGADSSCTISNNTGYVTYAGGSGCTKSNNK